MHKSHETLNFILAGNHAHKRSGIHDSTEQPNVVRDILRDFTGLFSPMIVVLVVIYFCVLCFFVHLRSVSRAGEGLEVHLVKEVRKFVRSSSTYLMISEICHTRVQTICLRLRTGCVSLQLMVLPHITSCQGCHRALTAKGKLEQGKKEL